jgi:hypothetical protein
MVGTRTITLHIHRTTPDVANVLRRDTAGYDLPRVHVLEDRGDELELKVPGHREATGYDRLTVGGNNIYTYVPVARVVGKVIGRTQDQYGNDVLTVDVPERRI